VLRQAITTVLGLCVPCGHRRQTITGRTITTGVHEMFLVCSRCGKRLSPGVLLGPGTIRFTADHPVSPAELAPASSLAK
jgi:hypothetical protein